MSPEPFAPCACVDFFLNCSMRVLAVQDLFTEVEMAQVDRWTFKILSLPVFDDAFSKAIVESPLANPTFVIRG